MSVIDGASTDSTARPAPQRTADFRVGTASWTDRTLVESATFYPPSLKTAEERLKFYAGQFNTVEVDSSYYAMPSERNSKLWAERTPDDFIFNVKAFAMLTQHPAETARLPAAIKELLTPAERAAPRLKSPRAAALELAFKMFASALAPLKDAHKLGMALFQFPPYFIASARNFDYLAALPARMGAIDVAVEFRHPSWLVPEASAAETMKFLAAHGLAYVAVDEPAAPSTVPPILSATGAAAYIRFHGRNRENWFRRDISVAERYKYLYSERELSEWAGRIEELKVKRAFVMFNNCYRNFGIMNATTMKQMLSRAGRR